MRKGKMIRYVTEITVLIGLIVVYWMYFRPRQPVDYPGKWIKTPGPATDVVRDLAWSNVSGRLIAASASETRGPAISLYDAQDLKWINRTPEKYSQRTCSDLMVSGNDLFAACFVKDTNPGGVMRSTDGGMSWTDSGEIPDAADPRCLAMTIANTLLVGTVDHGVYRSSDSGLTWTASSNGLKNKKIQVLAVDPFNLSVVYAATLQGLCRSTDAGVTWQFIETISGFSPEPIVIGIALSPVVKDALWVILRNSKGLATIVRSRDGGQSWSYAAGGLAQDAQPRVILPDPSHPDTFYIGTVYDGVYRSDDSGDFWSPMNNGLPLTNNNIITHALALSKDAVLFAGVDYQGGVWEYSNAR